GNEAYGNGSHGIIFSRGVVDGIVRDNHSHDNGGNGIVMDFESDRNLVEGNLVEDNQGDGIVILGSSGVTVRDNLVRGNRVGVRLNNQGAGSLVERNRIVGNEVGVEVYGGAHDTRLRSNRIAGSVDTGIVLEEAGATSRGDAVSGGSVGVEIRAPASLEGTRIEGAETGVRVTERGIAAIRGVDVEAHELGVEVAPGGVVRLERSTVRAATPVSGDLRSDLDNDLGRPLGSLPWFAIAGVTFVVLAFVLQVVHRTRDRATRRPRSAPEGVVTVR
ncbi:MAG TPA: right-handed parallel beta-helix repeat-containing protein, partial [Actinomycetota bacterium]